MDRGILPPIGSTSLGHIYTSSSDIVYQLRERRGNIALLEKVEGFLGSEILDILGDEPRGILSRTIASPNMEFLRFCELSSRFELSPLVLEYPDKFVAKNRDKYHLCKLYFYKSLKKKYPILSTTRKIVNFNCAEGKKFTEIKTTWGADIIDFHHHLIEECFPNLSSIEIINFSQWFNKTRYKTHHYYLYFLSLFICHGVLFENYLEHDKEEAIFIRDKLLPSFIEVERIFGVKPLIFPLVPDMQASDSYWHGYTRDVYDYLSLSLSLS